jgi:GDP-L-fucose synthase
MNWKNKKILVTGGNGFLGSSLVRSLEQLNPALLEIPLSSTCDLRLKENCEKITQDIDIVFHIAAHVGGIGLNEEKPGELFYDNLLMGTYLMDEARKNGVEKFISLGTMCSYPKITPQPIKEEFLWDGYPEEVTSAYGLAKKMQIVQSLAYKQQYDFNSITVFVTNLYGPNDNFIGTNSHVIPAIIEKFWYAKKNNLSFVELWGDGTPTRDFLYVDDASNGLILAAEKYENTTPLNLGSGNEISINKLANQIMKLFDFDIEIKWNTSMPNGQSKRCVSFEKAKNEIGFNPKTNLEEGLKITVEWYKNQHK